MSEKLIRPAIKTPDGEIYTGDNYKEIAQKHGVEKEEGYITDTLRFVTREEASKILYPSL